MDIKNSSITFLLLNLFYGLLKKDILILDYFG